ncbi:glycosyltransferase [Leptolyngbya boryana CZ1]|uniref:Glycosyltransferase n=1 Tax=Leptolyngbya boryana CZ1 TaxID=3060204 RepID=A0AA97AML7_LEPBY|nr:MULTISPECIES: glycosyltransferase [Leptolyngbya]MBD1855424.1 glycosyltransferase [Leptolyngbya sp. FACHB-1624]MBN8564780.1 glycosyltransferase [Leptolyngbya sp. UWPOB_LEPTO1]WNZ43389.1 glycosyltransferase [Leptolyngbya boryana CZ1]
MSLISVVICTHNPREQYLQRVLDALQRQTLPLTDWELLIIDNASQIPLSSTWNLSWHPLGRIIREKKTGLTAARLCGYQAAKSEVLVFVDDDNVLEPDYLAQVHQIFQQYPGLGAIGGKSIPDFEIAPESWMVEFYKMLALRDFGEQSLISQAFDSEGPNAYPDFAPAGIGLAIRQSAFQIYAERVLTDQQRLSFGRTGQQLTSGEDNDIVLTILEQGWQVGYFPELKIIHIIAASRLNKEYLARLNYASTRSWVQVLRVHRIEAWQRIQPWTVMLRKLKAFLAYQAWRNAAAYVRWRGACGLYEGLAE